MPNDIGFQKQDTKVWHKNQAKFLAWFYFLILFTMTKTAREISFDKL